MGTHPIFESDFDCLTEIVWPSQTSLWGFNINLEHQVMPPMSNKPQILQRRLVATLKSICARRRDGWKKSFKNFSPSQIAESESIYANFKDREQHAEWMHRQSVALHLAPDSMALAFGLFDRILFSMKVKKSHLPVLAAASVSLASKTLEDERCANLGKYLVKASGALFSVRDLKRMEMMVITKVDWKIEEATCMDFLFNLFDFSTLGSHKKIGNRTKNIVAHFLASQLTNFDLARIPALEQALGMLMIAEKKSTAKLRVIAKMHKIPINFALATEAATILKPKFVRIKIPSEFLVDEDETVERETLNSVRKLFSAGCLDPTPFGTKSFAEITADC